MTKILITGGAGFVPSSLADKLLENPKYQVVCVDNFLTGAQWKVPKHPNCKFIKCDVNKYDEIAAIMTSHNFDYVFHYAAVVGVKRTLDNPVLVLEDIQGIENVLRLSKNTGVKRVFYSSSSEVYGEPVHLPQHEHTTPLNSRLPYAIVKNLGEAYCRSFKQEFNLDYTILRFFNTYGPKQSTDFVMSKFIDAALRDEPITIYGDGSQTRTFFYIEDNVEATLSMLEENLVVNDVINVGNDRISTIKELAELIIKTTNSKSEIIYLPPLKEGDMSRRQPDVEKLKEILDRDFTLLEDGLSKVIEVRKAMMNNTLKTV
ncbi:NAD-dependent epimerase/dehydratase family protein [Flammeovirga kamogawensis]|uniref:NAD-dependent epimerase/dehydratase family protein n=1 Tax=Flammeovirga kamogawensis TaxID=373891 RepID=A0ABX8GSG0_9BACT|nr:NAD-dependent epimerase/dehydratase family protein [Flammeovirga kamogawensis]MBB6462985.1 UDP-glucose 4-epimerase [Flammeovirga kamogawensis]QWG06510.1 NAD-dependent epimerase/dehydratase family protein [Flammeovirga kamogawensis]TRX68338.1 NAD-dependent epimerase/dehydratase family protein [Flammeovirga kamogawensis]